MIWLWLPDKEQPVDTGPRIERGDKLQAFLGEFTKTKKVGAVTGYIQYADEIILQGANQLATSIALLITTYLLF